jgi:hypothetical protein
MNKNESSYPLFCLFFAVVTALVSATAAKDRELALAGMGFASSILSSGGTAYHYEKARKGDPAE